MTRSPTVAGIALFVSLIAATMAPAQNLPSAGFAIRGTLPWHNFLSGPAAWNFEDYQRYIDDITEAGANFIGFHAYTGGAQRYVTYVQPFIRVGYRGVLPEASLETSMTPRWGYTPMMTNRFTFGTDRLFTMPVFGADAAVNAFDNADRYRQAQALMQSVVQYARNRGLHVGFGFEFGVYPPEFYSLLPDDAMLQRPYLPDPTHPANMDLFQRYLASTLQSYNGVDYLWLWLQELPTPATNPKLTKSFDELMQKHKPVFGYLDDPGQVVKGVWVMAYLRQAHAILQAKAPNVTLVLAGWGGDRELTPLLQGLHDLVPRDIIFAVLNPNLGTKPHPPVLATLDGRKCWAIPWLEGDNRLWHPQYHVARLAEQIGLAAADKLDGVIGIHWRTLDIQQDLDAFFEIVRQPPQPQPPANGGNESKPTITKEQIETLTNDFYDRWCTQTYGPIAAKELAPLLAEADLEQQLAPEGGMLSPEYAPYEPTWGRMPPATETSVRTLLRTVERVQLEESGGRAERDNLDDLHAMLTFVLLLDEVGRDLEPAQQLRDAIILGKLDPATRYDRTTAALRALDHAPLETLFTTYASHARSRGELGIVSSLNQKLGAYVEELRTALEHAR